MSDQHYEGWAIVEIMGHRERAGSVVMDDNLLVRIDIPVAAVDGGETTVTEFYGRAAIFSLRPCTEEIARRLIRDYTDPRPVRPVDYRSATRALPDHSLVDQNDFEDEEVY